MLYFSFVILSFLIPSLSWFYIRHARKTDKALLLGIQVALLIILYKVSIRLFLDNLQFVASEWPINILFIAVAVVLGLINTGRLFPSEKVSS